MADASSYNAEEAGADTCVPRHVGIIMDGNGRWAEARGVPRIEGHRAGAEAARRAVEACRDAGVTYLTLYAFSTENWRRPPGEVRQLMALLRSFLNERLPEFQERGVRLRSIGRTDTLPASARKALDRAVRETCSNTEGTLILALSYGGREEILQAVRRVAAEARDGRLDPDKLTEADFEKRLYTADVPDPDLIIRTSGEQRLSNFLTWQSAYAELWFTSTYWPDFSKEEFQEALRAYSRRQRRFGRR